MDPSKSLHSHTEDFSTTLPNRIDSADFLGKSRTLYERMLPQLITSPETNSKACQTIWSWTMAAKNPWNFANRPTDEVKKIAPKGGQVSGGTSSENSGASSGGTSSSGSSGSSDLVKKVTSEKRNADGTFAKGGAAAQEASAKGGST